MALLEVRALIAGDLRVTGSRYATGPSTSLDPYNLQFIVVMLVLSLSLRHTHRLAEKAGVPSAAPPKYVHKCT